MHARRTRFFCNLYNNSACIIKSSFITKKKMCRVHMRVFEIVAHRNVDDWTQ